MQAEIGIDGPVGFVGLGHLAGEASGVVECSTVSPDAARTPADGLRAQGRR